MNNKMKRLRRYYLTLGKLQLDDLFTYNDLDNGVITEFYYGQNQKVMMTDMLDNKAVKAIGSITFSTGALKFEDLIIPNNQNNIQEVIIPDGVEKIE